jgi:hypothetical protein
MGSWSINADVRRCFLYNAPCTAGHVRAQSVWLGYFVVREESREVGFDRFSSVAVNVARIDQSVSVAALDCAKTTSLMERGWHAP